MCIANSREFSSKIKYFVSLKRARDYYFKMTFFFFIIINRVRISVPLSPLRVPRAARSQGRLRGVAVFGLVEQMGHHREEQKKLMFNTFITMCNKILR